jgi:hypothetical protein
MRDLVPTVLLIVMGAMASGCMVRQRPTAFFAPSCHPSQYWDGTQCRHKGKGQGARKHDGPPGYGKKR